MIKNISIKNRVATFDGPMTISGLQKINYFFGYNGTGKSTLGKIIGNIEEYPTCELIWKGQNKLKIELYNREFIEKVFVPHEIQGVFTLEETAKDTAEEIKEKQEKLDTLNSKLENYKNRLHDKDGKENELTKHRNEYANRFFDLKRRYGDSLSGSKTGEGLRGYMHSKESFMKKLLEVYRDTKIKEQSQKDEQLQEDVELDESFLTKRAESIFSNKMETKETLFSPESKFILGHESNPILQKVIVGKDDLDISTMINKLNNSDWVRQGLEYFEMNGNTICPFCQQLVKSDFKQLLNKYFDEEYTRDIESLEELQTEYSTDTENYIKELDSFIESESEFLDLQKLKECRSELKTAILTNKHAIQQKLAESSRSIKLTSLKGPIDKIANVFELANEEIRVNNETLKNLEKEKISLTKDIWNYMISLSENDILVFNQKERSILRAIENLRNKIDYFENKKEEVSKELSNLQTGVKSVEPTIKKINSVLESFGFKNFSLGLGEAPNTYKLVREDGSDVRDTLSEGEKHFVTFLYFYYLLSGSQDKEEIDLNKIVVIDDPVSSLDNEVLFIVSSLIREIIDRTKLKNGNIKQIFILTHNLYFHKEVSFTPNQQKGQLSGNETFWLVKKNNNKSIVEKQDENPIKTSYELLWDQVKDESRNNLTIQNTLRRILETYFKLLGGIAINELYDHFEGEKKYMCKSLCSWIHDGSHNSFSEEFYSPLDSKMIDKYLEVFEEIFIQTKQHGHYNMMMER